MTGTLGRTLTDEVSGRFKAGLPWPREYQRIDKGLHALNAWTNAQLWLEQAARGEVPHGGYQPSDITDRPRTDYTEAERPGAND